MLPFRRYGAPPQFTLPGAGSRALFFGDSISDLNYRHWANKLMDDRGWVPVNQTYLGSLGTPAGGNGMGNFETNVSDLIADTNCTVAQSGTLFDGTLAPVTSAHSAQITASAAGNMWASFGTGFSNFMELGNTYTFTARVRCGATVTPGNVFLQFNSTGNTVASANSASLTATATFQRLSVTLALVNGTDAYLRAVGLSMPSGAGIQVDGAELRRVTAGQASNTSAAYEDWATRGAIAGTTLQAGGTTGFAARVAAYSPLDVIVVEYGMNDLYGAGAGTTTPATWKSAVATCIANIQAMSGPPKIIWLGLTNSQDTWTAPSAATWGVGLTGPEGVARQMDAITRAAVMNAGGIFIPMRRLEEISLIDVGANARHPLKPVGENWMYDRITHALTLGF